MIIAYEDLPTVRRAHQDETLVLAGGCFDIVHEGHVRGLEFCRNLGDILVVGVSSDARIRERKGPSRPIRHELGRLAVVAAFKPVDYAFILPMPTEQTPTIQAIDRLRPDVFADQIENQERWEPSRELIESFGCQLAYNTSERPDSSTALIHKIQSLTAA